MKNQVETICLKEYNYGMVLRKNCYHSIAFPLISAGIYGGALENPVAESVKQCKLAVTPFKKMTEVLTEVNFKKVKPLIPVLEEKREINPKKAEEILNKSTSTTYRYLSMLVEKGILIKEGSTNKAVYRLIV